ncbi:MAG: TAXI family TRAP transporter solute-binding subunit [Rhodospirillum sp.]|nr:TAXI family TRAP transporter solute-binding subunit [Rhodospirillum sp.]MCF8489492.1 TAXI family TRAP transporter solute-binding subunit [Rhodospirillum sp.]MCF8502551.1 TAXI family TRAP transporter solute-binding subunit [Rhodospirillum sp.]
MIRLLNVRLCAAGLVVFATFGHAPRAEADPVYRVTLAGASAGGSWSVVGLGLDKVVSKAFPGSTVTYQTSGGGFANIPLVATGRVEMGIAQDLELQIAGKGEDPFKEPITGVRALARVFDSQVSYNIVSKRFAEEYGIKNLKDIAEKKPPLRVAFNRRGMAVSQINEAFFDAVGISVEDIEEWGGQVVYAASNEQVNLLTDRRIDMLTNGLFVPNSSILQAANSVDLDWLDTLPEAVDKIAEATVGRPYVVKAGAYAWLDHDVNTVAHGALLIVSDAADEGMVHDITKALIENADILASQSKSLKDVTPELMAKGTVVPFHPGAERAYREAGLLK